MMNFTLQEKAAIFHIAMAMIQADGKKDPRELVLVSTQMSELNIDDPAMSLSTMLSIDEVLSTIRNMSYAQKVYVTQFLTALAGIDGNLDNRERELLAVLTIKCKLPLESASETSLKHFFDKVFNIM